MESFVLGRFSWFGCERIGSCPFLQSQKIHLYALIIAILQRFNIKKLVPTLAGNHKIISNISFLLGVRMQTIMRGWRIGGGSVSRGNPHTSSSPARFHVYIRREILSLRPPKQAFLSFSSCSSPSGKRPAIQKHLLAYFSEPILCRI